MKISRFLRITGLTVLLSISNLVMAKDYTVDLVIFESLSPVGPSDYSSNLFYPIVRNPVYLGTANADDSGFTVQKTHPDVVSVVNRLKSSSRYSVIDHVSWRQPGLAENLSRPVRLSYGDMVELYLPISAEGDSGLITALPPGSEVDPDAVEIVSSSRLSGSVSLSLGRFLHLDTNLVLIHPEGTGSARLQAKRRMRSNEIHYIDNPRFGLIVLVTPVPEEEVEETESSDPPES